MQLNKTTETPTSVSDLASRFSLIRARTESICKPLAIEDYSVQPVDFVSPPKWHLAHSSWFFETFILQPFLKDYKVYSPDFSFLFNSYYQHAGERISRANRGLMTRPTVDEVLEYRQYVTKAIVTLLDSSPNQKILQLIEVGVNHEEQHQELLLYDIKYILGHQPSFPSYADIQECIPHTEPLNFITVEEGLYTIGHDSSSFCFDNELGVHQVYLQPYAIADRLITNKEYLEFMLDGGYQNFTLWHSDGWDFIKTHQLEAPLYWHRFDGEWQCYQLSGFGEIPHDLPVMHLSYYEAFAFAEWSGKRLPTEFEWEIASCKLNWGNLWEWTGSAYLPYPGFRKAPGALGEYNGKFMVNQHVLRGASSATPDRHKRHTYRNFFHPNLRWMFSGIRLAK